MSEAKFTPGPWEWRHLPSDRGPDWMVLQIGGLTVEAPGNSVYIACHQADQRLMAATPDLLEALRMVEQLAHGDTARDTAIRNTARAAISKALGEPSHG